MRRLHVGLIAFLLLFVPAVAMAQDKVVELIFSAAGSKVTIQDTIDSVANVTMELNGTQYVLSVPVKIDIDATMPLSSSLMAVDSARRVGQLALNIVSIEESDEDVDVLMSSTFGGNEEKEFEPSEGNKIAVVRFIVANVGNEPLTLYSHMIKGVDDAGRLFEEVEIACKAINPDEKEECVIVFDLELANHIVALDVEVQDHQQLAVPKTE